MISFCASIFLPFIVSGKDMPGPMIAELMFSLDDCVFKAMGFILGNLEHISLSAIDFLQDYGQVI